MTTPETKADCARLERLLRQIAAGDREALAQLYERTRGAVYALVLSYLKNHHDAQDVTQDVFVRVWDSAGQYRVQGSAMGWLLTVARNLALMHLRKQGRTAALEDEEWNAIPAPAELDPAERAVLQDALVALEDKERRIVLLHAVSGLKHREIARVLELPLPTVLSKYHRALKKCKARLEGEDVR